MFDPGPVILIASFIVPLCIMIGIIAWLRKSQKKQVKHAESLQQEKEKSLSANARIITCELALGAGDMGNYRIVRMYLEILPLNGEPFQASATWFVDLLHLPEIRIDNIIAVKYSTDKKIFPDVNWAKYSEGY